MITIQWTTRQQELKMNVNGKLLKGLIVKDYSLSSSAIVRISHKIFTDWHTLVHNIYTSQYLYEFRFFV